MKGDTDSHLEICKRSPSDQTRCKKREIAKKYRDQTATESYSQNPRIVKCLVKFIVKEEAS